MTAEQKRQYWQAHIDRWQESDLTQKAYCQEHDLTKSSFSYWRKRFNSVATGAVQSKFIPVNISCPQVVVLAIEGIRIELPASSFEQLLPTVIRAVRVAR